MYIKKLFEVMFMLKFAWKKKKNNNGNSFMIICLSILNYIKKIFPAFKWNTYWLVIGRKNGKLEYNQVFLFYFWLILFYLLSVHLFEAIYFDDGNFNNKNIFQIILNCFHITNFPKEKVLEQHKRVLVITAQYILHIQG